MQQDEVIQVVGTTTDFLIQELTDEKGGQEFAREYLKADFLAAAVDALFYARRQAGLTQEQVAQKLGKKQEAIARWEADTDGKMSLRQYVEIALACGRIPLEMVLAPVDAVRRYIIENPQAPWTPVAYDAWQKKELEPATLAQSTIGHTLTVQAGMYPAQLINMIMSNQEVNQEGKPEVRFDEQPLKEQYLRHASQIWPQWIGEGATNTVSVSPTSTLAQAAGSSAWSAVSIDKVAA